MFKSVLDYLVVKSYYNGIKMMIKMENNFISFPIEF